MRFNASVMDDVDLRTLGWKTPALEHLECGRLPDSAVYGFEGPLRRVIFRPGWPYDGRTILQLLSNAAETVREIVFDLSRGPGVYFDEDEESTIVFRGRKRFPLLERVSIRLLDDTCDATLFRVLIHCDFSNASVIEIETFPGYRDGLDDEDRVFFDQFFEQLPSRGNCVCTWGRMYADNEHGDLSTDQYERTVAQFA